MLTGTLSPTSNKQDWSESISLTDDETDEAIDLSDVDEITIEVRNPLNGCTELSGTMTGGEISIIETGVFSWSFTAAQMGNLCPRAYEVGCIITKDDQTIQLLIGQLPVIDGIVS